MTPCMDVEVIGVGGSIALLSKAGCDVVVVYLTDGAGAFKGHVPEGEEWARYSGVRRWGARGSGGFWGSAGRRFFSTSRILGLTSLSRGPWIGWWS